MYFLLSTFIVSVRFWKVTKPNPLDNSEVIELATRSFIQHQSTLSERSIGLEEVPEFLYVTTQATVRDLRRDTSDEELHFLSTAKEINQMTRLLPAT